MNNIVTRAVCTDHLFQVQSKAGGGLKNQLSFDTKVQIGTSKPKAACPSLAAENSKWTARRFQCRLPVLQLLARRPHSPTVHPQRTVGRRPDHLEKLFMMFYDIEK